jgi:hypothetical protein
MRKFFLTASRRLPIQRRFDHQQTATQRRFNHEQTALDTAATSNAIEPQRRPRWRVHRKEEPFKLTETFLSKYANRTPPFGFNGLGEVVYLRTYSRVKEGGQKEAW